MWVKTIYQNVHKKKKIVKIDLISFIQVLSIFIIYHKDFRTFSIDEEPFIIASWETKREKPTI